MVKVYAPASIGNVSVGFDVLGAAVSPIDGTLLGDCVSVEAAETFSLQNAGRFVSKLPAEPKENIVYQCWERFCQEIGREVPVAMRLEKNMPIGSGLGSSACSVVAGLMAMNEFCDRPLDKTTLLGLMGELEGRISGSVHYDNVAPCYLGGLQLMLEEEGIISRGAFASTIGCGSWPIRASRSPPPKRAPFYPRNTVVRIASATAAIWPALSMPATPGSRSWPPN